MLTEEQILSRIRNVCAEVLKADIESVTLSSRFREDLGADSLDMVTLLMALENEFEGTISDEEAKQVSTVQDALKLLQARQQV